MASRCFASSTHKTGHLSLNVRSAQFDHFGDATRWLPATQAKVEYELSLQYSSSTHYGLNSACVSDIERVDAYAEGVDDWLAARCSGVLIHIVFGCDSVVELSAQLFCDSWRDMLCPARDDAIIFSQDGEWLLFYCHEDEFEFGRRRDPPKPVNAE